MNKNSYLVSSSTSDTTKSSLFVFCVERFPCLRWDDLRLFWLREDIICFTRRQSKDNELEEVKGSKPTKKTFGNSRFKTRWANHLIITNGNPELITIYSRYESYQYKISNSYQILLNINSYQFLSIFIINLIFIHTLIVNEFPKIWIKRYDTVYVSCDTLWRLHVELGSIQYQPILLFPQESFGKRLS